MYYQYGRAAAGDDVGGVSATKNLEVMGAS